MTANAELFTKEGLSPPAVVSIRKVAPASFSPAAETHGVGTTVATPANATAAATAAANATAAAHEINELKKELNIMKETKGAAAANGTVATPSEPTTSTSTSTTTSTTTTTTTTPKAEEGVFVTVKALQLLPDSSQPKVMIANGLFRIFWKEALSTGLKLHRRHVRLNDITFERFQPGDTRPKNGSRNVTVSIYVKPGKTTIATVNKIAPAAVLAGFDESFADHKDEFHNSPIFKEHPFPTVSRIYSISAKSPPQGVKDKMAAANVPTMAKPVPGSVTVNLNLPEKMTADVLKKSKAFGKTWAETIAICVQPSNPLKSSQVNVTDVIIIPPDKTQTWSSSDLSYGTFHSLLELKAPAAVKVKFVILQKATDSKQVGAHHIEAMSRDKKKLMKILKAKLKENLAMFTNEGLVPPGVLGIKKTKTPLGRHEHAQHAEKDQRVKKAIEKAMKKLKKENARLRKLLAKFQAKGVNMTNKTTVIEQLKNETKKNPLNKFIIIADEFHLAHAMHKLQKFDGIKAVVNKTTHLDSDGVNTTLKLLLEDTKTISPALLKNASDADMRAVCVGRGTGR